MSTVLEAGMIILFGFSWPVSILKSWRARTSKGKSLLFLVLVWVGYICGVAGKLLADNITYVVVFYVLNFLMVTVDICLYFRNAVLDRRRDKEAAALAAEADCQP